MGVEIATAGLGFPEDMKRAEGKGREMGKHHDSAGKSDGRVSQRSVSVCVCEKLWFPLCLVCDWRGKH